MVQEPITNILCSVDEVGARSNIVQNKISTPHNICNIFKELFL